MGPFRGQELASLGMDPAYLPPPLLGQHTDAILGQAGYSAAEVLELRAAGAV